MGGDWVVACEASLTVSAGARTDRFAKPFQREVAQAVCSQVLSDGFYIHPGRYQLRLCRHVNTHEAGVAKRGGGDPHMDLRGSGFA